MSEKVDEKTLRGFQMPKIKVSAPTKTLNPRLPVLHGLQEVEVR